MKHLCDNCANDCKSDLLEGQVLCCPDFTKIKKATKHTSVAKGKGLTINFGRNKKDR